MADKSPQIRPNVAFRRLARDLEADVRSGKWMAGEHLPSRRDLAKRYAVTPNTVNKAIHALVGRGLLTTSERHGTLVAQLIGPQAVHDVSAAGVPVAAFSARSAETPSDFALTAPRYVGGSLGGKNVGGTVAIVTTAPGEPVMWMLSDASRADYWLGNVARSLETALADGGVRVRCFRSWSDAFATPAAAMDAALATKPSGLVVINIYGFPGYEDMLTTRRELHSIPTLLLTSIALSCPLPQVTYDQSQFGYVAGRHLTDAGYRRIVALRMCATEWLDERLRGATRAVRAAGIAHTFEVISPAEVPTEQIVQTLEPAALSELMVQAFDRAGITCDGSTAVLLPSDRMALALATVLSNRGVTLGRDLGLLGFDDTIAGRVAGLTTVRPPFEAMGAIAARRIMQAMTEGSRVVQETIAPILLPRTSTERR